ncbi:hypothetical protein V5799_029535 [Amblyomma americanum]|uniref:Uncharacterized protein n=1 Tax=Amblyomma americanum TaxID=6943 RepID=A0AAQ4EQX7_AMBAM
MLRGTPGNKNEVSTCISKILLSCHLQNVSTTLRCSVYRNAGDENVMQVCVSHLTKIREEREKQQKDYIGLFCMLLDSRLRRLPRHVAKDLMHNTEMVTYDVQLQTTT